MKILSILKWILILSFAFPPLQAFAQTTPVRKKSVSQKRMRKAPQIRWKLSLDWLNGVFSSEANESVYNPGNRVFKIPDFGGRSDLILDYRLTYGSKHKFIARPRFYSEPTSANLTLPKRTYERNRGDIDFLEVFTESWLSNEVSFTLGLQNFQWGPAEIIAPSNPIFHFNREQRSLLWREKGHALARLNWTPSAEWSHVLMVEAVSNEELEFIHDRKFKPKTVFKSEIRDSTSAQNYIGLTGGTEEESRSFAGMYFNYMPTEGFSFYADARYTEKPYRFEPRLSAPLTYDLVEAETNDEWQHVGVFGLRLETEDLDFRAEVISNPMGYNETQFQQALLSTNPLNPNSQTNALRFLRPGLELYGRSYGYLSLRFPDIGKTGLWTASLRYLQSGMDESGIVGLSVERTTGDHLILLAEGRQSTGKPETEFMLQEKYFAFLGLRLLL